MPRYVVQHKYMSWRDGTQYGPWNAGTAVELREHDAQWVNRDSPGCLLDEDKPDGLTPPGRPALVADREVEVVELPPPDSGEKPPLPPPVVVAVDGEPVTAGGADPDGSAEEDVVPEGTAQVVLEWVAGDPDKAQRALEAEQAKGDAARSTLVGALERIAAAGRDRMHRGGRNRAAG